jgi:hypothetical protein
LSFNIGTVPVIELNDGSGQGIIADSNSSAQRVFLTQWSNRAGLIQTLVGGWSGSGTNIAYTPPQEHPDWSNFWCRQVQYQGIGLPSCGTNGVSSWEWCKATATYQPLGYDPSQTDGEDLVTEELDFALTDYVVKGGTMYVSGSSPVEMIADPKVIQVGSCDYVLTLKRFPVLPGGTSNTDTTQIFALLGKLNHQTFYGAAAKKMLFKGCRCTRSSPSMQDLDEVGWDIQMRFQFRQEEWDKVLDKNGTWQTVILKNGQPLSATGNLSLLIPT